MPRTFVLVSILALGGCATAGRGPRTGAGALASPDAAPATVFAAEPLPPPPAIPETAPRLVIPTTGGPPVMAIPLGGGLYLPVTGGPPRAGIPVGP